MEGLRDFSDRDELDRFAENSAVANIGFEAGSIQRAKKSAGLLGGYADHHEGKRYEGRWLNSQLELTVFYIAARAWVAPKRFLFQFTIVGGTNPRALVLIGS